MDARAAMANLRLFRGAAAPDIEAIAAAAESRTFAPGEHLFDPQHPAHALFAIVIGTVEITLRSSDRPIVTVGSGQSIGDLAFFNRSAYGGSAQARETTSALCIPFDALDRLLAERPGLALVFYRNAAHFFANHLRHMAAERDRPYL